MIKLSQILLSEQRFTSVKLRDGSIAHVGDLVTIDSLIEDHPYKKTSIIKSIDQWDGKGTIVYVEYPNGQTHEQTYHRFDMIKYEESILEYYIMSQQKKMQRTY